MAEKNTGVKIYDKDGDDHRIASYSEVKEAFTKKQYVLKPTKDGGIFINNTDGEPISVAGNEIRVNWAYVDGLKEKLDAEDARLGVLIQNNTVSIEALQGSIIYIGTIASTRLAIERAQVVSEADWDSKKAYMDDNYPGNYDVLDLGLKEKADELFKGDNSLLDARLAEIRGSVARKRGYCLVDKQNNAWVWTGLQTGTVVLGKDKEGNNIELKNPDETGPDALSSYNRWVNIGYTEISVAGNKVAGDSGNLGLVKGVGGYAVGASETVSGFVFVNADGTMKVNGWDELTAMGVENFYQTHEGGDLPGVKLTILLHSGRKIEDIVPVAGDLVNGVMSTSQQVKLKTITTKDVSVSEVDEDNTSRTISIKHTGEGFGNADSTETYTLPNLTKISDKTRIKEDGHPNSYVQGGLHVFRRILDDEHDTNVYHINTRTTAYECSDLV
jgi:hypothetical protein